jgi:hypothetical protein
MITCIFPDQKDSEVVPIPFQGNDETRLSSVRRKYNGQFSGQRYTQRYSTLIQRIWGMAGRRFRRGVPHGQLCVQKGRRWIPPRNPEILQTMRSKTTFEASTTGFQIKGQAS